MSVNSRNRLDYFLRVLEEAGWPGKVVDETRIDPSRDLRLGLLDCHDVEALSEGGVDQTVVE